MTLTVGDVLPFATTVRDAAGVLANAGTMTLAVTLPDGTAAAGSPFTISPVSTGLYEKVDLAAATAGQHMGRWLATGANAGSHVQVFDVRPITAGIVSLDDVKKHINNPTLTTAHDDELEIYIEAAAVWLNGRLGTSVVRGTITDERQYGGSGTVMLRHTPVASITTVIPVAVGGTAVTVADLDPHPGGYITYKNGTSTFPSGLYLWTYVAGPQVVDARISLAAREIVKGLWESQRGASGLPMQGELEEIPGMSSTWSRVNTLIADLRMPGVA
jgi:hypothetical protein